MELKIYSPQDNGFAQVVKWNFQELKAEISETVRDYEMAVYTDDTIKQPGRTGQSSGNSRRPWRTNGKRSERSTWSRMSSLTGKKRNWWPSYRLPLTISTAR